MHECFSGRHSSCFVTWRNCYRFHVYNIVKQVHRRDRYDGLSFQFHKQQRKLKRSNQKKNTCVRKWIESHTRKQINRLKKKKQPHTERTHLFTLVFFFTSQQFDHPWVIPKLYHQCLHFDSMCRFLR